MAEPLYAPLKVPTGGWPKLARRVELIGDLSLDEAVYVLADRARFEHVAQVALYHGADLWAYPHQTTAEIVAVHQRMRSLAEAKLIRALKPGPMRWTPESKLAVVLAAKELFVERRDLLSVYGIGEDELASWEIRYARFGVDGLAVHKGQTLRLSPTDPDAFANASFTQDFTEEALARG